MCTYDFSMLKLSSIQYSDGVLLAEGATAQIGKQYMQRLQVMNIHLAMCLQARMHRQQYLQVRLTVVLDPRARPCIWR